MNQDLRLINNRHSSERLRWVEYSVKQGRNHYENKSANNEVVLAHVVAFLGLVSAAALRG